MFVVESGAGSNESRTFSGRPSARVLKLRATRDFDVVGSGA
jgi:hypothetical protein